MRKNGNKKKRVGAIIGMIIAIIVLLGIAALLFVQGRMSKISRDTNVVTDAGAPSQQTFEVDENAGPDTIKPEAIRRMSARRAIVDPAGPAGWLLQGRNECVIINQLLKRRYSLSVECDLPKVERWVRFPLPA